MVLMKKYSSRITDEKRLKLIFNLIDSDQQGTIDIVNWSLLAEEVGMPMSNMAVKEMIYNTSRGNMHTLEEFEAVILKPKN